MSHDHWHLIFCLQIYLWQEAHDHLPNLNKLATIRQFILKWCVIVDESLTCFKVVTVDASVANWSYTLGLQILCRMSNKLSACQLWLILHGHLYLRSYKLLKQTSGYLLSLSTQTFTHQSDRIAKTRFQAVQTGLCGAIGS